MNGRGELRSSKPLSMAKNKEKELKYGCFKMGLQCDTHKHSSRGWWILSCMSQRDA